MRFDYCCDGNFGMDIVDVLEIPSEKKIDSSCSGDTNVQRILFTISRHCASRQQIFS